MLRSSSTVRSSSLNVIFSGADSMISVPSLKGKVMFLNLLRREGVAEHLNGIIDRFSYAIQGEETTKSAEEVVKNYLQYMGISEVDVKARYEESELHVDLVFSSMKDLGRFSATNFMERA